MLGDRALTVFDLGVPVDRPLYGRDLVTVISKILQPIWTQTACGGMFFVGQVTTAPAGKPRQIMVTLTDGDVFSARYDSRLTPTVGTIVYGWRTATQAVAIGSLV